MSEADEDRIRAVCAELCAQELLLTLRRAVAGAPHWRFEAQRLLERIDNGILLQRYEIPSHHQHQDAA